MAWEQFVYGEGKAKDIAGAVIEGDPEIGLTAFDHAAASVEGFGFGAFDVEFYIIDGGAIADE